MDVIQGHKKIAHGGFLASLFDESFGIFVHFMYKDTKQICLTASLKVDYRNIVSLDDDKELVIIVKITRIDGRKIYLSAEMRDLNMFVVDDKYNTDNLFGKNQLYATSESLFIITRDSFNQ
jgi:acyl-coenzyme A thioesterase PaaI-like protein